MKITHIVFTKSFTRVLNIDGKTYKIIQDEVAQTLSVFNDQGIIYKMFGIESAVVYHDDDIKLARRILHQAQLDRYAL